MAVARKREGRSLIMDREKARRLADALNRQFGVTPDPTATAEKARALSLASGVKPEENAFSRELIRRRNRDYDDTES